MKINLNVDVHHLARIEGHGNIHVKVRDGQLKEARWDIVETPRFFEAIMRGKHYTSVPPLASRICGICSISHTLVSLRATEAAFGVQVPDAARLLRLLAKHGETLQSHTLHLFFLAAPDFLGLDSAIPLLEKNPKVVDLARRLKGMANRICDVTAGRSTHPVSLVPGGVTRIPAKNRLRHLRHELSTSLDELRATVELFAGLPTLDFERETEWVSLGADHGAYPWIGGKVVSTDGVDAAESDYLSLTNEQVVPHNTSKWCRLSRETMAVGALARFNNNAENLHPEAKKVAEALGLSAVSHNPHHHNQAQLTECAHAVHESMELIDRLLALPDDAPTRAEVTPKQGYGVGAVEAPRGILYHAYRYGDDGRITEADCVIPTTQNNANIQHDLAALVKQLARTGTTDEELELRCSMLVRAYDPCVSCSVH